MGGTFVSEPVAFISADDALALLRAAGHNAQRSPARGRCRTLCYLVGGQYVNLGRLRQMAAELSPAPAEPVAAEPAPAPQPVAAEPAAPVAAEPARPRPVLPGEAQPPAAPAPHGAAAPTLPTIRPQATAAELTAQAVELEAQALQALQALAEIPALSSSAADIRSLTRQLTARATELRAVAAARAARAEAQALAAHGAAAPTLPALRADAAAGRPVSLAALAGAIKAERSAPTGEGLAGQPWDPGTPAARAAAALQSERVGILWPISQALRGEGVALPPTWQHGGPVLDGTVPLARALAALPLGAIATAAAALAALPPVTAAQDAALSACRTGAVPGRPYL